MSQHVVERPRHLGEIQRLDEQPCVPNLSTAAAADEAPELLISWATSPRGLLLQCAKRSKVTLSLNDLFHGDGTQGADQLVLQVGRAYEEAQPLHVDASEPGAEAGPLETAPEVSLLPGVADTGQPDVQPARPEQVQELSDRLRAPDGHNRNPLSMKVATTALGQSLQRTSVAQSLNQHNGTRNATSVQCASCGDEGCTGISRLRSRRQRIYRVRSCGATTSRPVRSP
jgi:hypothetical protein